MTLDFTEKKKVKTLDPIKGSCKVGRRWERQLKARKQKGFLINICLKAIWDIALDSLVATTNYNKLSGLEHKFIVTEFCMSELWHSSHQAKLKVLEGLGFCPGIVGENTFPCLV